MVLRKRMKSICVAMFPDLYMMRWLSSFLKHLFPNGRFNLHMGSKIRNQPVTARSWSKNRSSTSSRRPLCGAYTSRNVTTRWPTISFTQMILLESLCTSKTFSIYSSATNTPTQAMPLLFPDQEYSSLFIIVINLIFTFSLWCIDWVGSLYANRIFMYFCIKSSIGTQGEVS